MIRQAGKKTIMKRYRARRWLQGAVAAMALDAAAAAAEGDPARGLALARSWCASCHQVEAGGPATDTAPSFRAVANDPAKTEGGLRAWLADPHSPMPNLNLSRQEIDDIIAYLASLRRP
jgi:mono/diheme cytochrome c family protein